MLLGFAGVGGQAAVCHEGLVPFDGKAQAAADLVQLVQRDPADLRRTEPRVAQTVGPIGIIRVQLGQQPRGAGVGVKSLTTGLAS